MKRIVIFVLIMFLMCSMRVSADEIVVEGDAELIEDVTEYNEYLDDFSGYMNEGISDDTLYETLNGNERSETFAVDKDYIYDDLNELIDGVRAQFAMRAGVISVKYGGPYENGLSKVIWDKVLSYESGAPSYT